MPISRKIKTILLTLTYSMLTLPEQNLRLASITPARFNLVSSCSASLPSSLDRLISLCCICGMDSLRRPRLAERDEPARSDLFDYDELLARFRKYVGPQSILSYVFSLPSISLSPVSSPLNPPFDSPSSPHMAKIWRISQHDRIRSPGGRRHPNHPGYLPTRGHGATAKSCVDGKH